MITTFDLPDENGNLVETEVFIDFAYSYATSEIPEIVEILGIKVGDSVLQPEEFAVLAGADYNSLMLMLDEEVRDYISADSICGDCDICDCCQDDT